MILGKKKVSPSCPSSTMPIDLIRDMHNRSVFLSFLGYEKIVFVCLYVHLDLPRALLSRARKEASCHYMPRVNNSRVNCRGSNREQASLWIFVVELSWVSHELEANEHKQCWRIRLLMDCLF